MLESQKKKAVNWLERPLRENEKRFHFENLKLSEILWSLADENLLHSIETALEQILMNRNIPGYDNAYSHLTDEQVVKIFVKKKISLFNAIPEDIANPIKERIDRLLQQSKTYAIERKMSVPNRTAHLSIVDYYNNYKISKRIVKLLSIQTYKK